MSEMHKLLDHLVVITEILLILPLFIYFYFVNLQTNKELAGADRVLRDQNW